MYTDSLAVQIFNLSILLDLEKIAIGGGISASPLLLQTLKQSMEFFRKNSPQAKYLPLLFNPELVVCKYKNDANLLGAYQHFNLLKKNGEL